jgi:hypothetical protein
MGGAGLTDPTRFRLHVGYVGIDGHSNLTGIPVLNQQAALLSGDCGHSTFLPDVCLGKTTCCSVTTDTVMRSGPMRGQLVSLLLTQDGYAVFRLCGSGAMSTSRRDANQMA